MRQVQSNTLLSAVTTSSTTGTAYLVEKAIDAMVQVVATVATSATVVIEGSIDGTTYGTIDSSTKTADANYFVVIPVPLKYVRAKTGAVTSATVTVTLFSSYGEF